MLMLARRLANATQVLLWKSNHSQLESMKNELDNTHIPYVIDQRE